MVMQYLAQVRWLSMMQYLTQLWWLSMMQYLTNTCNDESSHKADHKSIIMTHHTKMCFHKSAETKKPENLTHVQI